MNFKSYFSDLSCWEEFEIKRNLLGKKKNDFEILNCFRKIESWYFLVINKRIVFLDEEGNKVDGKDVEIKGCLDVSFSEIESLEGSPKRVRGSFYCDHCHNLKSLEGCPEEVVNFQCGSCMKLKSLEGCPKKIRGWFDCSNCSKLKSLKGCPKKASNFYCSYCSELMSLEGCPEKVGMYFACASCMNLKSLDGCPKEVGKDFDCYDCPKIPKNEIPDCKIGGKLIR